MEWYCQHNLFVANVTGSTKSAHKMFVSLLLLASSAALFLTVGSQGPCVPANCSAAMGDLPPLCNCDENCTVFGEDCCGPQHLEPALYEGCVVGGEGNRCLVCGNVSSNVTVACPAGLVAVLVFGVSGITERAILGYTGTVELLFDRHGQPLVACIQADLHPGITVLGFSCFSLSILGGVFMLVTFSLFRELRTLSGIILMNLSVAIILLNVSNIARFRTSSEKILITGLSFQMYFVCSEFVWLTLLLVQMAHSLHQAWRLSRPSPSKWRLILVYMPIGWGLPLVLCVIPIVLFNVVDLFLFVLIFVPLLTIVVLNLSLLVAATVFVCVFSRNRRKVMHSYHCDLIRLWVAFFAVTLPALSLLLGVVYSAAVLIPNGLSIVLDNQWIVFVVLILRGAEVFIISFAFLCTKKTIKLYRDLFTCTSRNSKPAAIPMGFPGPAHVPESPGLAEIRAEIETPSTGEGGASVRDGEVSTGEGDNFVGVLEAEGASRPHRRDREV